MAGTWHPGHTHPSLLQAPTERWLTARCPGSGGARKGLVWGGGGGSVLRLKAEWPPVAGLGAPEAQGVEPASVLGLSVPICIAGTTATQVWRLGLWGGAGHPPHGPRSSTTEHIQTKTFYCQRLPAESRGSPSRARVCERVWHQAGHGRLGSALSAQPGAGEQAGGCIGAHQRRAERGPGGDGGQRTLGEWTEVQGCSEDTGGRERPRGSWNDQLTKRSNDRA